MKKAMVLVCILLVCGCLTNSVRPKEVTFDQLISIKNRTSGDTIGALYYMGTKGGFHYFQAQYNIGREYLRISDSELRPDIELPYSKNRKKWVECAHNPENGVFSTVNKIEEKHKQNPEYDGVYISNVKYKDNDGEYNSYLYYK